MIHVSDATVKCHTGAFKMLYMTALGQCTRALHVEVHAAANGKIMPPSFFWPIYPTLVRTDGTPSGLYPSSTRFIACKGKSVTQYGTLDMDII